MKAHRIRWAVVAVVGLAALGWGLRVRIPLPVPNRAGAAEVTPPTAGDVSYAAAFDAELEKIGPISPQEFARRYAGGAAYVPGLSWDPTSATYWDRVALDPNQPGRQVELRGDEGRKQRERLRKMGRPIPEDRPLMVPARGLPDYRLDAEELAKFRRNGFVVSERLGGPSCTELYYGIYKRDLPVFITTDAVLHAWHRSYDALLQEVEVATLLPSLDAILAGMAARVPAARRRYAGGPLGEGLADADYFLTVARSLLSGSPARSALGQGERVSRTLQACSTQQMEQFELFGRDRLVDFSQFKPRGHYETAEELRRYFQAMMWCGRIDLRVAGNPDESSPRELAAAVILHDLLEQSGEFGRWQEFDRMLQTFVGGADSMTFAQLGAVLAAAGIRSPADVRDPDTLSALQRRIAESRFGAQEIRGDLFVGHPSEPGKFLLPRSFTFLGQRFAADSWVTAKVVFDDVTWDGREVMRRVPSGLDVGFAAFGNDQAVPTLVERMTSPAGRAFRDGLNYQHNLAAARQVIDRQAEAAWGGTLYTSWLACLRELSRPTTDGAYPEALRTRAWAQKTLNTQLASWTQLRHDTILYVKQSYSLVAACSYPAGYVEPVPHFWARMEQMALKAARLIETTTYPDPAIQAKQAGFLRRFAGTVATLHRIAEEELAQRPLDGPEAKFLEDVVEVTHEPAGSGTTRRYAGWYPGLFYFGGEDSAKPDALVADVHTDPPSPGVGDPGCVLHQGVGPVDLLLIAVDSGPDRMVYAGPVLSHYEFEMPGASRKSDSEWNQDLWSGRKPPRPEWTRGYLVPAGDPQGGPHRNR